MAYPNRKLAALACRYLTRRSGRPDSSFLNLLRLKRCRYLRPVFLAIAGAAGFPAALAIDPLPPVLFTAGFVAGFCAVGGAGFTFTGFTLALSGVFTVVIGAGFFVTDF